MTDRERVIYVRALYAARDLFQGLSFADQYARGQIERLIVAELAEDEDAPSV